ncbi:hypothetical protein P1P75_21145 [Streptomyces sp. ID05-39B]|uniref:hypothetical protein n=1 Tax=Streptomyces sp. ID05-39B TaxID=3028664 RepID=UPI0029AE6F77|nr:hypothetical protein [Streptomyces sp. ID05-39B]MDX3528873.1 hypothetical protein [Streptomyces sp. ID05-39B]
MRADIAPGSTTAVRAAASVRPRVEARRTGHRTTGGATGAGDWPSPGALADERGTVVPTVALPPTHVRRAVGGAMMGDDARIGPRADSAERPPETDGLSPAAPTDV